MQSVFVELPPFQRWRDHYMDDDVFAELQVQLAQNPLAGDVIQGTGGLRKLRFGDPRRGKRKRGGLRVIYYWWDGGRQFWLFTLYDKDEMDDLNPKSGRRCPSCSVANSMRGHDDQAKAVRRTQ